MANSFNGEIIHFTAIRLRLNGVGNLQPSLKSLDEINTQDLSVMLMSPTTNKEPTRLANYIDQRGFLELSTSEINEWFVVSKITIFIKPLYTSYPG